MSIIQKPKRVTSESQSEQATIDALNSVGDSINSYLEQSYDAIMGGLTITDNLDAEYRDVIVEVGANGVPKIPTKFNIQLRSQVNGLICVRCLGADPIGFPFLNFVQTNNTVTINKIFGLQPDVRYKLILLVLGR